MNVYRVSGRLKAFIFFFSIVLILIFGSLLLVPFVTLPPDSRILELYSFCCSSIYLNALVVLLAIVIIALALILLINVFVRRVIFTNDSIISRNIFSTRKLAYGEIKGYKINNSMLYIVTNSNEKKQIAINLVSLERTNNLIRSLEVRFTNLDF
ncbi:hypothetical protein [Flavobacterium sp. YO12]|uniref:hypothetical protein n=1 Tax=unclassified Flavobacterium TaxID=196869 RepID=UPI00100BA332|nr:hypothetical protein [Flavobacterium sp. YO12]RXM49272.1 hypothetical protein BOW55_01590 [Flavobacterium sp. YO12]